MKKLWILMIVAMVSGMSISCRQPPVPQNAFRVKTRGKFHVFGIPLPFSVPNPGIALNLKTNTPVGSPGTSGSVVEYYPGGAYTSTNGSGYFDATNALLPAVWTARPAPNQSLCLASGTAQVSFSAVPLGIYKINCRWNVNVTFLVNPITLDLTQPGSAPTSLTATYTKNGNPVPRLVNATNLKARYYRNVGGEDYEFDQEKPVTAVSPDGSQATFGLPDQNNHQGSVTYKIVLVEDDTAYDGFVGVGDLLVWFSVVDPPPTCGPGGEICQ